MSEWIERRILEGIPWAGEEESRTNEAVTACKEPRSNVTRWAEVRERCSPDDFGAGMCIRCGESERDPKTGLGPCCDPRTGQAVTENPFRDLELRWADRLEALSREGIETENKFARSGAYASSAEQVAYRHGLEKAAWLLRNRPDEQGPELRTDYPKRYVDFVHDLASRGHHEDCDCDRGRCSCVVGEAADVVMGLPRPETPRVASEQGHK